MQCYGLSPAGAGETSFMSSSRTWGKNPSTRQRGPLKSCGSTGGMNWFFWIKDVIECGEISLVQSPKRTGDDGFVPIRLAVLAGLVSRFLGQHCAGQKERGD